MYTYIRCTTRILHLESTAYPIENMDQANKKSKHTVNGVCILVQLSWYFIILYTLLTNPVPLKQEETVCFCCVYVVYCMYKLGNEDEYTVWNFPCTEMLIPFCSLRVLFCFIFLHTCLLTRRIWIKLVYTIFSTRKQKAYHISLWVACQLCQVNSIVLAFFLLHLFTRKRPRISHCCNTKTTYNDHKFVKLNS